MAMASDPKVATDATARAMPARLPANNATAAAVAGITVKMVSTGVITAPGL